jgi:hypothetical protein
MRRSRHLRATALPVALPAGATVQAQMLSPHDRRILVDGRLCPAAPDGAVVAVPAAHQIAVAGGASNDVPRGGRSGEDRLRP